MRTQKPNQRLRLLHAGWFALCLLAALGIRAQSKLDSSPPGTIQWSQPPDFTDTFNAVFPTTTNTIVIGDEFPSTNSGTITQIGVWGSFFNDRDLYANDIAFTLTIWSDVPVQSGNPLPHPGNILWTQVFQPYQYDWSVITNTFGVVVNPNWYPSGGNVTTNLYYLSFTLPATNSFVQSGSPTAPTNYWLTVSTQNQDAGNTTQFGWKLSNTNYPFTANYNNGSGSWTPLYIPSYWGGGTAHFAFQITTDTNPPTLNPISIRQLSRTNFVLTWTTGILQVCNLPNLSSPQLSYSDVPGASSPYTNTTALSAQFYRLRSN